MIATPPQQPQRSAECVGTTRVIGTGLGGWLHTASMLASQLGGGQRSSCDVCNVGHVTQKATGCCRNTTDRRLRASCF